MTTQHFILVSPATVDGYPPVQYQAQLLADLGHQVDLVTTSPNIQTRYPAFSHPGVRISTVDPSAAHSKSKLRRFFAFARTLSHVRSAASRGAVEIAYDPIGMLYSDFAMFRPQRRIAHFHELLQHDIWLERRLQKAIWNYDHIVVPDEGRGLDTQEKLSLPEPPQVIPNYPLRAESPPPIDTAKKTAPFEVVYCGQLGTSQLLDVVIRSIHLWPEESSLVLIGRDDRPSALELKALVKEQRLDNRIHFLGWMPTNDDVESRMSLADIGLSLLNADNLQWRTALHASNKRFQYMKCGLPQIGDQNPGVPEIIEGQGVGICVTDYTESEVARVVNEYAINPARRAREGARAFALHQDKYNYQIRFNTLLDVINNW